MRVYELIDILKGLPNSAEVYFNGSSSCDECNPEGFDFTHEITLVSFKEDTGYPNTEKNVVVIE